MSLNQASDMCTMKASNWCSLPDLLPRCGGWWACWSRRGGPTRPITYFQRAAEAGDTDALQRAAHLLEKTGRTDEMARLRQYGIEPGGKVAKKWGTQR